MRRIVLVLALALLLLCGCKAQSPELKTLESVAVFEVTSGREIARAYQDQGETLGKPVYAQVRITYEPLAAYTQYDVYDEIVTTLETNNWERDVANIVPDYFSASLSQDGFTIGVRVMIQTETVVVYMEVVP